LHPGNVVANGRDFPAGEMLWRNQHCEIRFAARAGEGSRNVMFFPFRRFDAKNQHVFGEPALFARKVRTDAQRQAFFRKEDVSAVTGANRDDRVILRKMTNEAPLRIDIEQRMHPAVPFRLRIAAKPFDRDLPHSSHYSHAEHDIFGIRNLESNLR
jgi:hypothetical protein